MKKFTKIIAAAMAAVTIATTASVGASARTLKTGEEITAEVVDQYAAIMKAMHFNQDNLLIFSYDMNFYPTDFNGIAHSHWKNDGSCIDYWAALQKSKVRQKENGYNGFLDDWSTG